MRDTPHGAIEPSPEASSAGIRVLCVDDHALLVEGLRAQFAIDERIRIVGHLTSAEHLLEETRRLHPDVVLLDIEMPGPDAFEVADRLRHEQPGVRIIFLSAHVRDTYLAAAYKCGAWGYLAKSDDPEDIVAGIREVAHSTSGTFFMGPSVRLHCGRPGGAGPGEHPASTRGAPATQVGSLTAREFEILRLIGKGMSRTEIAHELCRSAKTIDGHQERIMRKLGVSSRAELIRLAIREGLAEA